MNDKVITARGLSAEAKKQLTIYKRYIFDETGVHLDTKQAIEGLMYKGAGRLPSRYFTTDDVEAETGGDDE